eukprot:scaffold4903_cov38-Prasinocladus_malaysianus.AAC.1
MAAQKRDGVTAGLLSWTELKARGDKYFKAGEFDSARFAYTAALEALENDQAEASADDKARLLGNRSMAAGRRGDWQSAAYDAVEALSKQPKDVKLACKMLFRVGSAAQGLGLADQARAAFQIGLELEPRLVPLSGRAFSFAYLIA